MLDSIGSAVYPDICSRLRTLQQTKDPVSNISLIIAGMILLNKEANCLHDLFWFHFLL